MELSIFLNIPMVFTLFNVYESSINLSSPLLVTQLETLIYYVIVKQKINVPMNTLSINGNLDWSSQSISSESKKNVPLHTQ